MTEKDTQTTGSTQRMSGMRPVFIRWLFRKNKEICISVSRHTFLTWSLSFARINQLLGQHTKMASRRLQFTKTHSHFLLSTIQRTGMIQSLTDSLKANTWLRSLSKRKSTKLAKLSIWWLIGSGSALLATTSLWKSTARKSWQCWIIRPSRQTSCIWMVSPRAVSMRLHSKVCRKKLKQIATIVTTRTTIAPLTILQLTVEIQLKMVEITTQIKTAVTMARTQEIQPYRCLLRWSSQCQTSHWSIL